MTRPQGDCNKIVPRCPSCGGRGWKLRSARRGLLVRTLEVVRVGPVEVECWRCVGTGRVVSVA